MASLAGFLAFARSSSTVSFGFSWVVSVIIYSPGLIGRCGLAIWNEFITHGYLDSVTNMTYSITITFINQNRPLFK
jgi:hypothetical protein